MKLLHTALALAALIAAGTSQAATLSSFGVLADQETDWERSISLQQFDSRLGTLNRITLSYSGALKTVFSSTNDDDLQVPAAGSVQGVFSFGLPNASVLTLLVSGSDEQLVDTGPFTLTVNASGAEQDQLYTGDFSPFMGTGQFAVLVGAAADVDLASGGNGSGRVQTTGNASFAVTYDYTANAVPEPGSLALVALALAGLGLRSARRRA